MILPTYLPGRKDFTDVGFDGSHDHGYAAFGYPKEIDVLRPGGGSYKRRVLQWGTCRDGFQGTPNEELMKEGFAFTHAAGKGYEATCFIAKVESILGIERSTYLITHVNYITWAHASPWWFTNEMRKSFYTLMLRAAYHYDHKTDNFEQAMLKVNYIKETYTAVKKFLDGYTIYEYSAADACDHWHRQFAVPMHQNTYAATYVENKANIAKMRPSPELISRKAYELWMQNGGQIGYDQDHWYAAEKLLREVA